MAAAAVAGHVVVMGVEAGVLLRVLLADELLVVVAAEEVEDAEEEEEGIPP